MCYNKNMKAKTTLLIQTIGMYVMHLPLFVLLITLPMPADPAFQESFHRVLFTIFSVMMAVMVPICVLNAVVSVKSALKGKENPAKSTMVAKLSLIPWYLLNFAVCIVFSSIFFNPFMMFAIPLIIAFSVAMTYTLMLTTSLGDIVYYLKKKMRMDEDVTTATIVAVVFLFIFCLDVIGAIMLYRQSKKLSAQAPEAPQDIALEGQATDETPAEEAQADASVEESAPAEQDASAD